MARPAPNTAINSIESGTLTNLDSSAVITSFHRFCGRKIGRPSTGLAQRLTAGLGVHHGRERPLTLCLMSDRAPSIFFRCPFRVPSHCIGSREFVAAKLVRKHDRAIRCSKKLSCCRCACVVSLLTETEGICFDRWYLSTCDTTRS